MEKLNCWEVLKCGREPRGEHEIDLGVCPASIEEGADGINGGKFGGRLCWAIVGTLCGGKRQGTHVEKQKTCMMCDFYRQVFIEQKGEEFQMQYHCPFQSE